MTEIIHLAVEHVFLKRLKCEGFEAIQADTAPLLLTAGRGCYDTVDRIPRAGIFAFEKNSHFHGFVDVKISEDVVAKSAVVCTPTFITILVKIDDWLIPFCDIRSFVQNHNDTTFESVLLKTAIGSLNGYRLYIKTMERAIQEQQLRLVDDCAVPAACSHLVLESCACLSKLVEIQSEAQISDETATWFADTLELQGVCTECVGISRFYDESKTIPSLRFVLQSRANFDFVSTATTTEPKYVERRIGSLDAIVICMLKQLHHGCRSSASRGAAGGECSIPHWTVPDRSLFPVRMDLPALGTPLKQVCNVEGIHAAVASTILNEWQLKLFLSSPPPCSIKELLECFDPLPTVIVKQRLLMLFHPSSKKPTQLCSEQAAFVLKMFSTAVVYDSNTHTASRYVDSTLFRLSTLCATKCVEGLLNKSQQVHNEIPTKRLRHALKLHDS